MAAVRRVGLLLLVILVVGDVTQAHARVVAATANQQFLRPHTKMSLSVGKSLLEEIFPPLEEKHFDVSYLERNYNLPGYTELLPELGGSMRFVETGDSDDGNAPPIDLYQYQIPRGLQGPREDGVYVSPASSGVTALYFRNVADYWEWSSDGRRWQSVYQPYIHPDDIVPSVDYCRGRRATVEGLCAPAERNLVIVHNLANQMNRMFATKYGVNDQQEEGAQVLHELALLEQVEKDLAAHGVASPFDQPQHLNAKVDNKHADGTVPGTPFTVDSHGNPTGSHGADHGGHDEHHSTTEKIAHLAHEAHLIAELAHEFPHLRHMKSVLVVEAQLMKSIKSVQGLIARGQRVSGDVQKALQDMLKQHARNKHAFRAARTYVRLFIHRARSLMTVARDASAVQRVMRACKSVQFQGRLAAIARVIRITKVGRSLLTIGRFFLSPKLVGALMVVGALFDGINGFLTSEAQTLGGKIANGVLDAGVGVLIMWNPIIALADLCAPEEWKLSTFLKAGTASIVAIGEHLITGDSTALQLVRQKNASGENGVFMKWIHDASEEWAEKGFIGALSSFWDSIWTW